MTNKSEMDVLVKAIKKHTTSWTTKYFTENEKQTKKGKELSKLVSSLSFAKTDKAVFAKLVSIISDEDVVLESEEDMEFRPITAFVLTKLNTTDAKHSYETEKVLVSIGDGTAISPEGVVGGLVPRKRSIMRPATSEEIDGLTKVQIEKLMEEVNIIVTE